MLGFGQGFRDRVDQFDITRTESFLNKRRVSADEIDAADLGNLFQCVCKLNRAALAGSRNNGNRCDRNPLVYDGNAIFLFDILPNPD